ncbi:MAG: hypothetical protein JWO32_1625 [Bacteroidetes bacterium]|nr:hypothetical protein [Bacteroidota bacterium]
MMRFIFYILFFLQPYLLFQQNTDYFKVYNSLIGNSAISITTLTAKTYSFNLPLYKIVTDTVSGNLYISTRQKDAGDRFYTNKGYHLILNKNDSACCVLEESKLDLTLAADYLLLSSDTKSARINRKFGYEQFEYPSKILYPILKNNSGLTYNPTTKVNGQVSLSCISLNDGSVLWSAPVNKEHDWNDIVFLNDSVLLLAAGGLHAINIQRGLAWSYSLTTHQRNSKPYIYSLLNPITAQKYFSQPYTSDEEGRVNQLASNILITDSLIYFASANKLIALNKTGKLIWEKNMSGYPMSKCVLQQHNNKLLLINLGVARYNENLVVYGNPFVCAFNKFSGDVIMEVKNELKNLLDITDSQGSKLLADKNLIIEVTRDAQVKTRIDLTEEKFGNFLEFINGNTYFVEKEGFYVPLNFINDNVIYFKTDHGKVFGMSNNNVEYEYHFTELYQLNKKIDGKTLISQKNKSLLLSSNYEPLQIFNTGEKALFHNNKIYFPEGRLLYIMNVNELK